MKRIMRRYSSLRAWFSGRTRACQARDRVSITLARTKEKGRKSDFKTTLRLCITWGILGIKDKGHLPRSMK